MMDIKRSNNEMRELKESLESLIISHELLQYQHTEVEKSHEILQNDHTKVKKSHEILQDDHTKVKKSHEILQDDHRKVTNELETIKTSQEDTVPWNIRARINDTLKDWKDNDDKMFMNTSAAKYVLQCIKGNSCVTITASSGVGKTATLRRVALQMAEEGYDVLIVTEPGDIRIFYNPNKKTLFVVDDLCGNFSLDQSDIKSWEPIMEDIRQILEKEKQKYLQHVGDISLVKWCCDHGVNVNRGTHNGQSPILIACEHSHTEIVNMLLVRGADCNKCGMSGQTPVMKACEHGHTKIVKLLLDRGADFHKCDEDDISPLMKACQNGCTEIVKMLSSLKMACDRGYTEIVKMLLDKGADLDK
ncbi:unnamed protein product [Mytilus coruscus]|uniref:Novel STAND NTPase 3 domain-containing protein n=1 Tax=Mytilus coruscus TaxID=42192 RepID=A0A6J8DY30_MYTCO|nr:unnamed protein product [Mytilus coruscus]